MIGDGLDVVDMCVYISLSISQNAIVLSPTKALNQTVHGYRALNYKKRPQSMHIPGSASDAICHQIMIGTIKMVGWGLSYAMIIFKLQTTTKNITCNLCSNKLL
jgi:hypothetical protein